MTRNGSSPHFIEAMDPCGPLCLCWPRPGEAPFSPLEQDFVAAGIDRGVPTEHFMAHMDAMAERVGADRVGYLLSVSRTWLPLTTKWVGWVATPWIRVNAYWTLDESVASLFAQKMVQYNACLALAYGDGVRMRASPLYVAAVRRTSVCYSIVLDAKMHRLTGRPS